MTPPWENPPMQSFREFPKSLISSSRTFLILSALLCCTSPTFFPSIIPPSFSIYSPVKLSSSSEWSNHWGSFFLKPLNRILCLVAVRRMTFEFRKRPNPRNLFWWDLKISLNFSALSPKPWSQTSTLSYFPPVGVRYKSSLDVDNYYFFCYLGNIINYRDIFWV